MTKLKVEYYFAPVSNNMLLGDQYADHKLLVRWDVSDAKKRDVGYMEKGKFVIIKEAEKLFVKRAKAVLAKKKVAAKKGVKKK